MAGVDVAGPQKFYAPVPLAEREPMLQFIEDDLSEYNTLGGDTLT